MVVLTDRDGLEGVAAGADRQELGHGIARFEGSDKLPQGGVGEGVRVVGQEDRLVPAFTGRSSPTCA